MKKFILLICIALLASFSYQAYSLTNFIYNGVSYGTTGQLQPSATVDVRITIQNTSGGYYQETHTGATTNQFGVFSVQVGTGGTITGNLGAITSTATTRISAETNLGGAGWVLSTNSGIADAMDNDNLFNATSSATNGDLLYYDGSNWVAKNAVIQNTGSGQAVNNMQPYLVLNFCIALQGVFPSRNIADPLLGTIGTFGFNFEPRGWAFCNGQLLAISQNTALFSLLGTMYGGNGVSTFALPDLRGRTPIHMGQGSGLTDRTQGETGGTETFTLTTGQLPAHSHTIVYQ